MKCNGTYGLLVQTLHGQFRFSNQRFYSREQGSSAFLMAKDDFACCVSRGLEELAMQSCLCARSYEKARQVMRRVTGCEPMRRQSLCNHVQNCARRLDTLLCQQAQAGAEEQMPELAASVDVYDPAVVETNLFADGILVKAQNPIHRKQGQPPVEKACQFHQAIFSLGQNRAGTYEFVMGTSDGRLSLPQALRCFATREWQQGQALALVALTDGAKDLRSDLFAAFGERLVIILDWYHLRKKVCELASMLVSTREARTQLKKALLKPLFAGKVWEALHILTHLPVRNATMHNKLMAYLTNHAHEIVDYQRRAQAGKTIGSGRMEKGVDTLIGVRQKDKGMSWSKEGSYALGMLTACHANGQWDQLWNSSALAA